MKKAFFGFLVSTMVPAALWASEPTPQPLQSARQLETQMDSLAAQDSGGQFSSFFYEYECIARNERRQYFTGHSHFPRKAEEIAMSRCYHVSRSCFVEGCHPR